MKANEDSKLLLFYLLFGGSRGGFIFYLHALLTTTLYLIKGG